MPAAIIGDAIAAVGAVGGAVISGHAANKAADTAAQTAANNNALQQQIYDKNTANLSPFMARGNAAGDEYNALLGLPTAPAAPSITQGGSSSGYIINGVGPDGLPTVSFNPQPAAQPAPSVTPQTAQNAFNTFQNSDGYKFRMDQGLQALNQGYAARGLIQSGAAMKGINAFAQGVGSDEFGRYLGYLGNQQGVGLSGANALAGVGTNYANAVSSNNNNAATVAGNADIAGANSINNALGNGLNAFSAFAGRSSSYGGGGLGPANPYGVGTSDGIY